MRRSLICISPAAPGRLSSPPPPCWLVIAVSTFIYWRRFEFRVGADEIRIDSGIFSRTHRSIPFDRIQDVDITQGLLARILGLAQVKFETGGAAAAGADEGVLAAIPLERAQQLRLQVRGRHSARPEAEPEVADAARPPVYAMDLRRLVLAGTFNFSLAVLAGLFGLTQTLGDVAGFDPFTRGFWRSMLRAGDPIADFLLAHRIATAIAGAAVLVLVGLATGITRTVIRDFGFRLDRVEAGLRRRRGLLTRTDVTLPVKRAQAALVVTGPVRDAFGWRELKLQSLARDEGKSGDHLLAPLAGDEEIAEILGEIGWRPPAGAGPWQRVSPAYVWTFVIGMSPLLLLAAVQAAIASPLEIVPGRELTPMLIRRLDRHGRDRRRHRRALAGVAADRLRARRRAVAGARRLVAAPAAAAAARAVAEHRHQGQRRQPPVRRFDPGVRGRRRQGFFRPFHPRRPDRNRAPAARRFANLPAMSFALGVERSVGGQPWRWRRSTEPGPGLEQLVDELLLARGVPQPDLPRHRDPRIRDFLPDPSAFQDMDKGAARLADAIEGKESIAIFGDYDVDGATSAALLTLLFRRLGADPIVYIPDRLMEGYGPSGAALVELKGRGASLAVTVDCGAQAFEALEEAKAAGLDVIVVDHHQCASLLPIAFAMINPNRLDEAEVGAAHGHLAAVGMAFLVGVAVIRELRARGFFTDAQPEPKILDLLDLVALGTVADVAKLHGLNRAFVTQGLKVMGAGQNVGLVALAEAARLVKAPSCRDLGFALGPRINAGGRVGKADLGVRLLTSADPAEAREIAAELDRLNEERRAIEMQVCEAAEAQAAGQAGAAVIVVMGAGWHPGVIGIVAGRIKERFGRPAIVIARSRGRHRQGLGPLDLGRRPRRRGACRQGQRPADRRRRARDGRRPDPAGRRARAVPRVHQCAARRRRRGFGRVAGLAARCAAGAGRHRRVIVRRARPWRALRRRLALAAGRGRAVPAAESRDRRRRPCPRHRLRRRRQELQVDRLPERLDRARPGALELGRR